jgi:competence protein ComEC
MEDYSENIQTSQRPGSAVVLAICSVPRYQRYIFTFGLLTFRCSDFTEELLAERLRLFSPAGFYAKNIAAWVILGIYAFLAGFTPSINRAVLMFFFFSFGKFFQRHRDPWPILALSGIPQILFNPFVVLSPGFILSYSTVAGIILFHKNKKSSLSLSMAAVFGTVPVLVYYFNTISLAGIFANLFYVPLFAVITFLAMSGVLIPFIPLNLFLDPFLNFVIEGTERIGENFAFLDISVSTPKIWEAVLYYFLIYIIYNKVKLSLSVKTGLL